MHIVVTGASSGIGAALAREFARTGSNVTIIARRRDRLDALAREFPERVHVIAHDLSNLRDCTRWIADAERAHGPIDVLVNNAGIQDLAPLDEMQPDRTEQVLHLNLHVPLRVTAAVLPSMLARKAGTIVDVASVAAFAPTPGITVYSASKAGLAAASEALRGELRGTGVHVVTVYPGIIADTEMGAAGLEKVKSDPTVRYVPQGNAAELARRVRVAVQRRRRRVIYPASMTLARWFPGITRWVLDTFTPSMRTKRLDERRADPVEAIDARSAT
jgi:short-subunit dehydrogenase